MKANFLGILICYLAGSFSAKAQEVIPLYSDYLTDNLYLLHPSMAGAADINKIRLTGRTQWFDVKDAPGLETLSVNGRISDKIGVGGILFNDQNGNYSRRGLYATFAYHILMSRSEFDLNQLSFGVSAGIIQHSLDETGFTVYDPVISGGSQSDIYGNVDVGMSYYYLDFYVHLTAKNILSVRRELFYSDAVPSNQRKYLASVGYVFSKNTSVWSYEPSLMFQMRDQTNEKAIDLNMKVYHDVDFGSVWGGISFRRSFEGAEYTTNGEKVTNQKLQYITPFIGVTYNNFVFAYTFSYQMNSIVLSNSGFHQVTLGYNFGKDRSRWECKCPAIN